MDVFNICLKHIIANSKSHFNSFSIDIMFYEHLRGFTWMMSFTLLPCCCFQWKYSLLTLSRGGWILFLIFWSSGRSWGFGVSITSFNCPLPRTNPNCLLKLRTMLADGKRLWCTASESFLVWQRWLILKMWHVKKNYIDSLLILQILQIWVQYYSIWT